ncbi:MAG: glycosyltransferase family 4 protein [Lachnospira sp.]|nr:glycosyltransferase family 4 protein [Lachnospira sp.]
MGSRPSGVGMYLYNFLKELVKCEELEFVLITDVAESEYIKFFKESGVSVYAYGKHFYNSASVFAYFRYVKKVLKEIKPDIFWEVNTVIPMKLKGDFKTMITIHDMFPIQYPEYFGKVYSVYFKHSLKKTLKNTDMILYNSDETKAITEKYYPEAKNIRSCTGYIIVPKPEKKADIASKGFLLYVGNMEKRKGVDLLLKAYKKYRELGGTKELVLAGKMLEPDVEKLLEDITKSTGSITYKSYVMDDEKAELYSSCGCYVFPSKAEGFGMPVIEVMWYNKPVIVSALPIFEEIVGECINRFDIERDELSQTDNLAKAMLDYREQVDYEKYKEVTERYLPETLSETVKNFILSDN